MAVLQYACPTCATDCEVETLPVAENPECVNAVVLEESEICDLYISLEDPANPGEALFKPADWTDPAAWATAIDNASTSGIKHFSGIGDMPLPEKQEQTIFKKLIKVVGRNYTLNFDAQHMSRVNYEWGRAAQCGLSVRFWFATIGGMLYGGENGIAATIDIGFPKERGAGAIATMQFLVRWTAKCDPPSIVNPMSETETEEGGGEGEGEGGEG